MLGVLLSVFAAASLLQGAQSVTLAWDPSTSPDVTGYYLYVGGASGIYTNLYPVGNVTYTVVTNLIEGGTYYFALTAFDTSGLESDFSNEVSYTVPLNSSPTVEKLSLTRSPDGVFNLVSKATIGHNYEIQASTDLLVWTAIAQKTAGPNGRIEFTDPDATHYPMRFYRSTESVP